MENWIWLNGPQCWVNLSQTARINLLLGAGVMFVSSTGFELASTSQPDDLERVGSLLQAQERMNR